MNDTLIKSLFALVPTSLLFAVSAVFFWKQRRAGSFLQLVGAGSLVIVVLTHFFEALGLFPSMGWGHQHSIGHYLDFWSAILGVVLVPAGYVLRRL